MLHPRVELGDSAPAKAGRSKSLACPVGVHAWEQILLGKAVACNTPYWESRFSGHLKQFSWAGRRVLWAHGLWLVQYHRTNLGGIARAVDAAMVDAACRWPSTRGAPSHTTPPGASVWRRVLWGPGEGESGLPTAVFTAWPRMLLLGAPMQAFSNARSLRCRCS